MDALPIEEATGLPHASRTKGAMHACGHDGHTAMLLGAAQYLAETRNFDGTAVVIFQPAEEGGGGGKEMVDDRLMERLSSAAARTRRSRTIRSTRCSSAARSCWRCSRSPRAAPTRCSRSSSR
jgi:metal-dependent amidase/aminoacylase/carboxypeptidase family protein